MTTSQPLLGEVHFPVRPFADIDAKIANFNEKTFRALSSRHRFRLINSHLLELIQKSEPGHFLLPAVLHFIRQVNELKVYEEHYTLAHFEFWLNLFSELSPEETLEIRGKIVGKQNPKRHLSTLFSNWHGKKLSRLPLRRCPPFPPISTRQSPPFGDGSMLLAPKSLMPSTSGRCLAVPRMPPLSAFLKDFLGQDFLEPLQKPQKP